MTAFTIFLNTNTGALAAVYDFNLPTVTGIGTRKEWVSVFHGEASGLLDKSRQCKAFSERFCEDGLQILMGYLL